LLARLPQNAYSELWTMLTMSETNRVHVLLKCPC